MNNLPIKFLSVEINNFRGVPGKLEVPLDAPLTVIYAANGTGKSTICYALEWLLTGGIEGVDTKDLGCQWGKGETSVSATCLIGDVPHEMLRKGSSFWLSRDGAKRVKLSDEKLLALLTPETISGKTTPAAKKSKRGWLRNSRWLYSNSLSLLIDNNRAEERQQIFADILGFGHLTSTLRDLKDYRKALPSTKGLHENIIRLSNEIEATERRLQESAPGRTSALANLAVIVDRFKLTPSGENFVNDLREAKLRVRMFEQRAQSRFQGLTDLQSQWDHFHASVKQVETLRRSITALAEENLTLTEQQKKSSDELSVANIKYGDGKRSVEWANEKLDILKNGRAVIRLPSVAEYFPQIPLTQLSLYGSFAELGWGKEKQASWRDGLVFLEQNLEEIGSLVREQRRLEDNFVSPPTDLQDAATADSLAKDELIRQSAKFDALADTSERLRELGIQLLNSSDTHRCPLCTHHWEDAQLLRDKVASKELMSPSIKEASDNLELARTNAQIVAAALAAAKAAQFAHEQFMKQLNAVKEKLASFEARTTYLQIMQEPDFSSLTWKQLEYLKERIVAAIDLGRIFEELPELEKFFSVIPKAAFSGRIEDVINALDSYATYYQKQMDEFSPERIRLDKIVIGQSAAIKEKTAQMVSYAASVSAMSTAIDRFNTLWVDVTEGGEITQEKRLAALVDVELDRNQAIEYKKFLEECDAVANIDSDAGALKKLHEERSRFQAKLDVGSKYITAADQTIEQYESHVKGLTSSSLDVLLGPAAELFSRMHANEVYKGLGVSEGTDHLHWTAFAEGHEEGLDAESKFSQGQRQDLALSLYLARARNTGGSFFLDEPIAHLDDLNRVAMLDIFRLVATSMPSMNLVLTTASESLARHMAQKFSSISDRHLLNMIHLEGNPRTGVEMSVVSNVPAFQVV
ncbi:AAA family ATPase [Pseudomonas sp. GL-B-19]|uniref:AAA family ATPase n=1 Tax=Pseudomonas sp. GL-B-19 TaxID=2832393 RepID=UPI001CBE9836|nr:AAA family ATPase [Pseudomonas sp. GL-B-19]